MARGNCIIVSNDPRGRQEEGFVGAGLTIYPGTIVQKDVTVALKSGKHTYVLYNADADGGRPKGAYWVVTERLQALQGKTMTDSYAAGERMSLYCPLPGDELNLLVGDVSGTGDDHAIGEVLIVDDGTGELIATTGTPETEVAMLLEAGTTDPTADELLWCEWTGY